MRWSTSQLKSRFKKLVASVVLAGASLWGATPEAPAEDVVLPSAADCESCFDSGIGGWNLYWHDPHECNSPCRCFMGNWTCPTAASPWIYGSVEFMPLLRDQLSTEIFAARLNNTSNATTTTTSGIPAVVTTTTTRTYTRSAELTEDDFSNAFDPGMRLSLGVALSDQLRLEGSYLGNYQWGSAINSHYDLAGDPANTIPGNFLSPFSHFGDPFGGSGLGTFTTTTITTTIGGVPQPPVTTGFPNAPVPGLDYLSSVHVAYSSKMSMAEVNLRRRLSNIATTRVAAEASVLLGFRQATISETLNYSAVSTWPDIAADAISNGYPSAAIAAGTSNNDVNVLVSNRLFGPQIGFQTQFLAGSRSWIDFEAKGAALFGTVNLNGNAQFENVPTLGVAMAAPSPFASTEKVTAFLGDLALRYNYQLTPSLTLNAGYNGFFLSGVALASRNLSHDVQNLTSNSVVVDHAGRVVYHGPSLGLVFAR